MTWTVAITGAGGIVGQFVVPHLLARGHRVRAWYRPDNAVPQGDWRAAVAWVPGDLEDDRGDGELLRGADAVIHLAFAHVPGRYRGGEGADLAGFYRRNLDGSRRLIASARRLGVPRFAFMSSRAVYGRRLADRPLDERHPTLPDTHYGAVKLALEAELTAHAAVDGWHAASLRCTGVYGRIEPVTATKWASVVADTLGGRRHAISRGGTEVHGDDVAAALLLLLTTPTAAGRSYVCSDVYVTTRAVARLVAPHRPELWPDQPLAPNGVLQPAALAALGWRPRGWSGVQATVADLVEAGDR